jgi:hypothetical protein
MFDLIEDQASDWHRGSPASETAIRRLISESGCDLPAAYLDFLRGSNGGEGQLGIEPGWFQLWPAEEVLELNEAYEVREALPGYFAFGGNGGGEMFVFKVSDAASSKVYMAPFIPLEEAEAVLIAGSFEEFAKAMGRASPAA